MSKKTERAAIDVNESSFIFNEQGGLEVRNAVILWPNFSGKEDHFGNSARTFNLVINEEVYHELESRGWKVKFLENGEDLPPVYYVNIKVNMNSAYPPIVTLYSEFRGKRSKRTLDIESIGEVDRVDIETCDMIISAYQSPKFPGKVTGYLRKMNVIQNPDVEFGGKYDDWLEEDINGADGDTPVTPF